MLLDDLYQYYGTWTNIGRQLNLGTSTYQTWRRKGYIPFRSQLLIEHQTKGLFKADAAHGEKIKNWQNSCSSSN